VIQRVALGALGILVRPSGAAAARPLEPLRALVVDDDRDLRDLLTGLIEAKAFTTPGGASLSIVQAENGRVALATLRAAPETRWLILLDLRMPELDGMQVWKAIATDPALAARCVVALLTADDMATVAEWQRQAGAPPLTTVFHKPYEPKSVLRWIERHVADESSAELV
jgi:CheY-like chemotaxis protein